MFQSFVGLWVGTVVVQSWVKARPSVLLETSCAQLVEREADNHRLKKRPLGRMTQGLDWGPREEQGQELDQCQWEQTSCQEQEQGP